MSKPNKLIKEKSPYLLQHANNPVDWNPWGDEAFEMAKKSTRAAVTRAPVKFTDKDKRTLGNLRGLAQEVTGFAERGRAPHLDVPSRSLSSQSMAGALVTLPDVLVTATE